LTWAVSVFLNNFFKYWKRVPAADIMLILLGAVVAMPATALAAIDWIGMTNDWDDIANNWAGDPDGSGYKTEQANVDPDDVAWLGGTEMPVIDDTQCMVRPIRTIRALLEFPQYLAFELVVVYTNQCPFRPLQFRNSGPSVRISLTFANTNRRVSARPIILSITCFS
jgi:hypothetical protein